jgi:hypothetical protein
MDAGLDEEFKCTVAEMKPHAKKLPQKSSERTNFLNIAHLIISVTFVYAAERHNVTLWIKKLLGVKYEK